MAKRIIYKQECEVINPGIQKEIFAWMIDKFNQLKDALILAGEVNASSKSKNPTEMILMVQMKK